jgi:hypothetical protein
MLGLVGIFAGQRTRANLNLGPSGNEVRYWNWEAAAIAGTHVQGRAGAIAIAIGLVDLDVIDNRVRFIERLCERQGTPPKFYFPFSLPQITG